MVGSEIWMAASASERRRFSIISKARFVTLVVLLRLRSHLQLTPMQL